MKTPVAVFFYNRPTKLKQLIEVLELIKPTELFCICDGPKDKLSIGNTIAINECKELISKINWECNIHKNYAKTNLGCKIRVESGLDWIFDNVEYCIILEDDCKPDISFFEYCNFLLIKYKLNKNISMISGDNFNISSDKLSNEYFYSKYSNIWGWATWSDRWKKYRKYGCSNLLLNPIKKITSLGTLNEYLFWQKTIRNLNKGELNTWDYNWTIFNLNSSHLSIVPHVNLVQNIGFDRDSTHTFTDNYGLSIKVGKINLPLECKTTIRPNQEYDSFLSNKFYKFITIEKQIHYIKKWLIKKNV
jgi:hypothetical protein